MSIMETTLTVPSGTPGKASLVVDLGAIMISESRQEEIAQVTPIKAPELLAEFNRSWRELHRIVTALTAEKVQAEKTANKRKGVLLLEEIPRILAEKKLSTSVDLREAVINTDETYLALTDIVDQISAVIEHLKGKMKSFENAFTSVKKIMGEDTYNMAGRGRNTNLSGNSDRPGTTPPSTGGGPPPRRDIPPAGTVRPGFGKPRYGNNG